MDNLKAALRSLISTPGPALIIIATLAIAIGANTAIFSVVNGVLLRPLGYGDDSRIVVPWATNMPTGGDAYEGGPDSGAADRAAASSDLEHFRLSPADYRDLREGATAFGGQVALSRYIGSTLTALEPPVRVGSLTVTPRLFSVLRATPALGGFFTDEDERPGGEPKVLITHASWTRRFGADPEIVGSTIELDGSPRTVIGVAEEGFRFPPGSEQVEIYFPMTLSDGVLLDRDHRMFDSIARLADGVTLEAARAEVAAIADRLAEEFPDSNEGWGMALRPLREELLGDLSVTLWVLSGAVFLVLLVACTNIANLLVARSTATGREFAVRAALGARPGDLVKRSLAESVILGALGGVGGIVLSVWGVAVLRAVTPGDIPRADAVTLDARVLAFGAVLSIGAAVLFGALPAIRSMSPDLVELIKPSGSFGSAARGGRRLRELMVVIEVALAIVLLIGAGLMVRSFARLTEVDPGFRQEGIVSVAAQLPQVGHGRDEWRIFWEQVLSRVEELPGVISAGAVSDLPMSAVGLGFELEFSVPGLDATSPTARPNADIRIIMPGYFEAMDMEIVSGRALEALDGTSDRTVGVVNETIVQRYFTDIDPIGRTLDLGMLGDVVIVGVVSDIRHDGLLDKYESEIFLPYGGMLATGEMHIVVRSDLQTAAVARAVGDVLTEMDPRLVPSQVVAISDLLWESVARPRFNTALLSVLALCAAVLAIVGTYGIVAYSVVRRTREIGVRLALGADSAATVTMIVRQALGIVLAGAALGIFCALGATRFLSQLLFDVPATDPLTYTVVVVGAVLVATLAAWLPARRATRIDPVTALREE